MQRRSTLIFLILCVATLPLLAQPSLTQPSHARLSLAQPTHAQQSLAQLSLAQQQTEEYWYRIERDGVVYGYRHITIKRMQHGYIEYRITEVRRGMSEDGRTLEERTSGTWLADSLLVPVSFTSRIVSPHRSLKVKGSRVRDVLFVAVETESGSITRKRLPIDGMHFDVMLQEYLHRKSGSGKVASASIDTRALCTVRRSAVEVSTGVWEVGSDLRIALEPDGSVAELTWQDGTTITLAAGRAAKNISAVPTTGRCDWKFLRSNGYDNVFNVRSAEVKLTFEGGIDGLNFEDIRQSESGRNEANGQTTITLKLETVDPFKSRRNAPILHDEFVQYLASERRITPTIEPIASTVSMLRGRQRNAVEIIKSFLDWLPQNFSEDCLAPDANAAQILQRRRGTSRQAAILLVALSRSAGIPARLAGGQKFADGSWQAAVWCEFWSDQWVPVDPLSGSFITGPSHIKMYDAVSAEPASSTLRALRKGVSLALESITVSDSSPAGDLVTGVFGHTYRNMEYKCIISAPDNSWIVECRQRGDGILVSMYPEREPAVIFELFLFAALQERDPDELLDARLRVMKGVLNTYALIEKGEMRMAGSRAPFAVYSSEFYFRDGTLQGRKSLSSFIIEGHSGYQFSFHAPAEIYDSLEDGLRSILRSFSLPGKE